MIPKFLLSIFLMGLMSDGHAYDYKKTKKLKYPAVGAVVRGCARTLSDSLKVGKWGKYEKDQRLKELDQRFKFCVVAKLDKRLKNVIFSPHRATYRCVFDEENENCKKGVACLAYGLQYILDPQFHTKAAYLTYYACMDGWLYEGLMIKEKKKPSRYKKGYQNPGVIRQTIYDATKGVRRGK